LISVASGVHAIKHALPVESWPPTRREGCSRASPAAFFAKTINWQTQASKPTVYCNIGRKFAIFSY
jgi:hypothetical protein